MAIVFNIVVFKTVWLACVIGAAAGQMWLGPAAAAGAIALHLWLSRDWKPEALLVVAAAALGLVAETALIATGLVSFAEPPPTVPWLAPLWLVAMWAAFATIMNVSLVFLRGRAWLGIVLGAALGPLAYDGGAKLGGMTFADPAWAGLAAVGVMWAICMPLLTAMSQQLDGWR